MKIKIELSTGAASCLGSVASAVGFESFKSILPKLLISSIDIDNSDIDASFMYFNELAEIMDDILESVSFDGLLNFILFVMEDDEPITHHAQNICNNCKPNNFPAFGYMHAPHTACAESKK